MNPNDPFRTTFREATREALEFLRRMYSETFVIPSYTTPDYDGTYGKPITRINWWGFYRQVPDSILEGPQCKKLVELLRTNPDASRHLDSYVGSSLHKVSCDEHFILCGMAKRQISASGSFTFNEGQFEKDFDEFIEFLKSPTLSCELVLPVYGLTLECELILDERTSFSRLNMFSDAQHEADSLIPSAPSGDLPSFALRIAYRTPKVIDHKDTFSSGHDGNQQRIQIENDALLVLSALRLFKPKPFVRGTMIHHVDTWMDPLIGSWNRMERVPIGGSTIEVSKDECVAFKKLWASLKTAKISPWVEIAVRRIAMADDRGTDEDRLIDLMIAAESIFLNDSTSGSSELRYRLSLRAAAFLAAKDERRELFRFFRDCYDVRSTIVHGGRPTLKGSPVNLDPMINRLSQLLRRGLFTMVESISNGNPVMGSTLDDRIF